LSEAPNHINFLSQFPQVLFYPAFEEAYMVIIIVVI